MRCAAIETDVFVAGGGPAGLAAALVARHRGFRVVLVDRARPLIDKACGEGLMPDGLSALRTVGISLGPEDGIAFRGIRFVDDDLAAEARFPHQYGFGIRRTVLHRILLERAEEAGVAMFWRTQADCFDPARIKVAGRAVHCRWIIGADGSQSRVRQWAGLPPVWNGARRIGLRQHFRLTPWTDLVEVHWHKDVQAYVTPVGSNEVCVAMLASSRDARLSDLPALFPTLANQLGNAERIGPPRGAISMTTRLRHIVRGPVALIGDASGAVDAITGEGLSLAFRQAVALGSALETGDLAEYEAEHRRMTRVPLLMARLLLLMGGNDGLRRRALRALGTQPRVFKNLLAFHVGSHLSSELAFDACALGWRLLSPRRTAFSP
jgi:menaquinone-9 beta-reductase